MGRERSVALARERFSKLFSAADRRLLPLAAGERVKRYTGASTAVVDGAAGSGPSLVDSTLPLRARDAESGELEPVDLDLEPTPAGWKPDNPLVAVRFGDSAGTAVSLGDDFTIGLAGSDATGARVANEIFFADVAPATDAWFGPSPVGARLAFQLRSEESPEELRLVVGGARVAPRVVDGVDGAAPTVELWRDGGKVGAMSVPVAFGADDERLPVDVRVEEREIVIEVAHRDGDALYPVAVDPVYENQDSWRYGNPNNAGWRFQSSAAHLFSGSYTNWYAGWGFYLSRAQNQWFQPGNWGEFAYYAPNDYSYIHRADFMHVRHDGERSNTTQGMWSRMSGGFQHVWHTGYPFDAAGSYWTVCADGGIADSQCDDQVNIAQSRGNYVQSSIWPQVSDWTYLAGGALGYFGGARIWMSDWEPPGLWYFFDAPQGWMHDTPAGPYNGPNEAHVRWGDRGLGMWGLWMDVPGRGRQYSTDWGGCSGTQSSRCPDSRAHNFSYAGISEGVQAVTTGANDVLDKQASPVSKTLRIDRSRPGLPAGSGSLYARANDFIGAQSYTLGIQGSDSYSGVQSVSYRVVRDATATQVASGSASNPTCGTYGCSTTWKPADFNIDASSWAAGRHTVEMTVKDQLGDDATHGASSHTRNSSFTVEMDAAPPTATVSHEGLEPWLGDDREVRTTVTGTDLESGVKSFSLDFPTSSDETRTRPCSGTGANRCLTQDSETFAYRTNTERFPQEGRHQLRATVSDGRGIGTASEPWSVNVDRTPPALSLSGALYDRRGQALPEGSYQLDALATDGDAGTAGSARSGVRSLDVLLDGESVDFSQQECAAGSCRLQRSWAFDTAAHPGGEHVVEVVAEDHLGHEQKQTFTFDGGPCCIGSSSVWANALAMGPIVFGDVNGDARSDALGRDPVSRDVEVGLSDGSRFGAFESWGAVAELRGLSDLTLGDVNYDGLDDLIGRDPVTGQVWVAASDGSAFEPATVWGGWPANRTLKVVDVDGDGSVDLAGRDPGDGRIYVGYSDDTAFEPAAGFTQYAVGAGDQWELADVDSDFTADLIVRSGSAVRVGLFNDSTFGALADWGSLAAEREALFGDVDGDGAADMLGYDAQTGKVTLSASTEASFEAATSFGDFPTGHRLELIDGDASGQADIAGEQRLLGDLRVALTDMVLATGPAAGGWDPDPEVVYDSEDETLPASDPAVELEDPPIQARAAGDVGAGDLVVLTPLRLGFQEERRINGRKQIPDPNSTDPNRPYISEQDAYGARANELDGLDTAADKGDGLLNQTIYRPLKAAGGSRASTKPIMRFLVQWGRIENRPDTMVNGVAQRYYFDKLDRAIDHARDQGFLVYLTLSGVTDFECNPKYNPTARACSTEEYVAAPRASTPSRWSSASSPPPSPAAIRAR